MLGAPRQPDAYSHRTLTPTSRFHAAAPLALQDDIKGLRVAAARLDEEQARVKALEAEVTALTHQLDVTAESHSETLRQLELAKFFLQVSGHGLLAAGCGWQGAG